MSISIKRLGWNGISTSKDTELNDITTIETWGLEKCNEFINMYEKIPREIIYAKINDIKKKWKNNSYEIHPSLRSKWKSHHIWKHMQFTRVLKRSGKKTENLLKSL